MVSWTGFFFRCARQGAFPFSPTGTGANDEHQFPCYVKKDPPKTITIIMMYPNKEHPHQGQPVIEKGVALEQARGAVILIHGRGATADSIISITDSVAEGDQGTGELAWLAPQAYHNAWYPYPFMTPVSHNEPYLTSALRVIGELMDKAVEAGVPRHKVVLAGFSQGACLASEYTARNADRYGGVVVFSGGLIGEQLEHDRYEGNLKDTPVFIGCSDIDSHIPVERVHETSDILRGLGADVTKRIYNGMGHIVNDDELRHFENILRNL